MDDLKIYERLSDLLYKDLLGMTSKEEKQELDSLCEEYGVKEMDRDKIVARLQGTDDFDGREAYRKFKILKRTREKHSGSDGGFLRPFRLSFCVLSDGG